MNVIKEIESITHKELTSGIIGGITKGSWHEKYLNSAWVYIGGMSYELSEGDVICFMSQWGEVEDIHLVRDKDTRKSLGYAFLKYEDQRSTILAVDNFNGMKLLGRILRCDHVDQYKLPKAIRKVEEEILEEDPEAEVHIGPGHAYKDIPLANDFNVTEGIDLWASTKRQWDIDDKDSSKKTKKEKKKKKDKKERKKERMTTSEDNDIKRAASNDIERGRPAHLEAVDRSFTAPTVASWRGNRDPATAAASSYAMSSGGSKRGREGRSGRSNDGGGSRTESEADKERRRASEFAGFGGMNRLR